MKSKLSLNKAWKECLRQWKWIVGQIDKGMSKNVPKLKDQWLEEHDYYSLYDLRAGCFFCQYAEERLDTECVLNEDNSNSICIYCPGRLVNKKFSCDNKTYDYCSKPKKFYQKLLELDAKRRAK